LVDIFLLLLYFLSAMYCVQLVLCGNYF